MSSESRRFEADLLLKCARTVIDPSSSQLIRERLSANAIDWSYVIERADRHRITPLLWRSLNGVCPELIPAEVLKSLRDYSNTVARDNLYRTRELLELLRLLEAHDIPALPFKGPCLSMSAYNDLGLRDYGDLDILVRPHDVLRTYTLLKARGYQPVSDPGRPSNGSSFSVRNKDLLFDSSDGRVRVELHWRLSGRHFDFPINLDVVWASSHRLLLAGKLVRTLEPEDLLLYLCLHGSRHGWERLLWICDVAELIRVETALNWSRIRASARSLGCERMLALGLRLTQDLLGTEFPQEIGLFVNRDSTVKALTIQTRRALFEEGEPGQDIRYWYGMHLKLRERLRDRVPLHLHYCRRYLRLAVRPNQRDREALPLSFFASMSYLVRPLRLLENFGAVAVRRLIGQNAFRRR